MNENEEYELSLTWSEIKWNDMKSFEIDCNGHEMVAWNELIEWDEYAWIEIGWWMMYALHVMESMWY